MKVRWLEPLVLEQPRSASPLPSALRRGGSHRCASGPPCHTINRQANAMIERIILVDYENVQPVAEEMQGVDATRHLLKIFHGPGQNALPIRLAAALLPIGPAVELIQCEKPGKDALDFHLAFHLGRLSVQYPQAQFLIVSRDRKGFAQLVEHGIKLGCRVTLVPSMLDAAAEPPPSGVMAGTDRTGACAEMGAMTSGAQPVVLGASEPCGSPVAGAGGTMSAVSESPAKKAPAKKAPAKKATVKTVAAKKVAAKKAAAKKVAAKKTAATSAAPDAAGPSAAPAPVEPLEPVDPISASPPSAVPAASAAPALKLLRPAPTPADLTKVITGLSKVSPEKRPAKATSLQRHVESHLRADLTEAGIADLLRSLYAQGWISEAPGGKIDYHLPRS